MRYIVAQTDTHNGVRVGYAISSRKGFADKWWMGSRESALREAARMERQP